MERSDIHFCPPPATLPPLNDQGCDWSGIPSGVLAVADTSVYLVATYALYVTDLMTVDLQRAIM